MLGVPIFLIWTSLADFTDLSKIMPASFASMVPDTIEQFRDEIRAVDIGSISRPKDFGGSNSPTCKQLILI